MKKNLIFLLLFWATFCFAQFKDASIMVDGYSLPYKVLYPENYDKTRTYPLLVFLHGAGERGDDNEKQLTHGKDFLLENAYSRFPAIVIAPQCPSNTYWSSAKRHAIDEKLIFSFENAVNPTIPMKVLMVLVQDWLDSGKVDKSRVYIGGLSMGGMGTFELLGYMPDTFAAAFAICGGGNTEKAKLYAANTAVWIFHGTADPIVPISCSEEMFKVLNELGGEVEFSLYGAVGHNSWDNVFQETKLFPWLFKHQKKNTVNGQK